MFRGDRAPDCRGRVPKSGPLPAARAWNSSWPSCPTCGGRMLKHIYPIAQYLVRERRVQPPRTWRLTRPALTDPFDPGVGPGATCWAGCRKTRGRQCGGIAGLRKTRTPVQEAEPDRFSRAHLRTLQRRVRQWRGIMRKELVYATAGEPMGGLPAMPELALVGADPKC